MSLRRCNPCRNVIDVFVILLLLLTVLYNEFFSHWRQSYKWPVIPPTTESDRLKILLVADAQLQGFVNEPWGISVLSLWDSDRYLRSTFSRAYKYARPDVVMFLGDQLDEGSIAIEKHYKLYVDRFRSIFHEAFTDEQFKPVFVHGDNDVGGEGDDEKTDVKLHKYEKYFGVDRGLVSIKFIDVMKANFDIIDSINESKAALQKMAALADKRHIRVVINHMSIMARDKYTFSEFMKMMKPSVIFSGHTHVSGMWTCENCYNDQSRSKYANFPGNEFFTIQLSDKETFEIVVPTCSYRMGVKNMGYGLATIDYDGQLSYAVLWQVDRYAQLFLYIYIAIFAFLMKLLVICINKSRRILPHILPYTINST